MLDAFRQPLWGTLALEDLLVSTPDLPQSQLFGKFGNILSDGVVEVAHNPVFKRLSPT